MFLQTLVVLTAYSSRSKHNINMLDPSIVLNKDLKEMVHCSPMNCSMHNDKTKTILQDQEQDQAFLFPCMVLLLDRGQCRPFPQMFQHRCQVERSAAFKTPKNVFPAWVEPQTLLRELMMLPQTSLVGWEGVTPPHTSPILPPLELATQHYSLRHLGLGALPHNLL